MRVMLAGLLCLATVAVADWAVVSQDMMTFDFGANGWVGGPLLARFSPVLDRFARPTWFF